MTWPPPPPPPPTASPDVGQKFVTGLRRVLRLAWPVERPKEEQVSTALIAAAALLGIALSILDWFGAADLSADRVRSFQIFGAGVVLLALVVEIDRRRTLDTNVEALRTAVRASGARIDSFDRTVSTAVDLVQTATAAHGAREIPPSEILGALEATLEGADSWCFRGGTARWERSTVFPALSAPRAANVPVSVHLLDPRDLDLCANYGRYRRSSRHDVENGQDTAAHIQAEILATIFALCWHSHLSVRVRPAVVLHRTFSPLRIDMGSSAAVLTVAHPEKPGLLVPSGSFLYRSLIDEFDQARYGLPIVKIPNVLVDTPTAHDALTADHAAHALAACRVETPDGADVGLLDTLSNLDFGLIRESAFAPYRT